MKQTVLWFLVGTVAMFLIVSAIFAIKLASEGRLPLPGAHHAPHGDPRSVAPAADAAPVRPPVTSTPAPSNTASSSAREFVSGAENILPPEIAHLAKVGLNPDRTPSAAPLQPQTATTPPNGASNAAQAASEAIATTLRAWAAAWQRKDFAAYLKHYAADFQAPRGLDHDAWVEQRRQRLSKPGDIAISIADIDIAINGDKATARFTQTYRSGSRNLSEIKTLDLALHDSVWQIVQERIGR